MRDEKTGKFGNQKTLSGLLFVLCLGFTLYSVYVRFNGLKRQAGDFEIHTKEVRIGKANLKDGTIYAIESLREPVSVSWLTTDSSAIVTGADFRISVEVNSDGTLRRYSLQTGGRVYVDFDGDGDADLRVDKNLDQETKEIRFKGVWIKAPNGIVNIGGKTYRATWDHGWKLNPEDAVQR